MAAVGSMGTARVKPRSDAYVGLLGLSLLALGTAMLFAFLSWDAIKEKPKAVQMAPAGGGARPAAPPAMGNQPPPPPAPGANQNPPPPPGGNPPPQKQ